MLSLPSAAEPLVMSFSVAFTEPTFRRFLPLVVGAILATGRRTVTNGLRVLGPLAPGHWSDYHRVFSRAVWKPWPLGRLLATAVLQWIDPSEPILVPVDDTTAQHPGKHVYGKGRHRDGVRSTRSHTVWKWGHKWVTLTISVRFPFTTRRWALPILVALYRSKDVNRTEKRRHKTPAHLARQLMAALIHWFPNRRFVLIGDNEYAGHEMARFCHRHRRHVTLISRFHPHARLFLPPPQRRKRPGRPRVVGAPLPKPAEVVAAAQRRRHAIVTWYGGGTRHVAYLTGTGHWYKSGHGLVPVRWVFVHDLDGTHREEYFYTTDVTLSAPQIIGWYTARWAIETTFQEVRAQFRFETTRQWVKDSVLRMGPCLMGLVTLIALVYAEHVRCHRVRVARAPWYAKAEPTFADAAATVRRIFWLETVFQRGRHARAFASIPPRLRTILLDGLSVAA